jgi:uncharacterized cupredoxin-like copper-binding protein
VLLAVLSTGHKVGLGLVGAAFIVFALISAFLIPSLRPEYPGRRGLPAFLTLTVALFVGMMFAVFFFGREPKAGHAAAAPASSAQTTTAASTSTQAQSTTTSAPATTSQASTQATTTQAKPAAPTKVAVSETEFKITLPTRSLTAGGYELDVKNDGRVGHDLVVKGPGVSNEKTPLLGAGKTATLQVTLQRGIYELYCSVPGHKQAGMDLKLNVS